MAECVSAFEAGMIFIALPRFGEIFGAPASTGWAVTAYMLVAATAALVGGRLGDLHGRKKVLIAIMLLPAAGSLVSVAGVSMAAIIAGRGIQGVAGAILPLCYGLAREALPPGKVSLAVGFISGAALLAGSGGSLIAGVLLDVTDWHMIFVFAAVPAVVASAVATAGLPPSSASGQLHRFDYLGAALLTPGPPITMTDACCTLPARRAGGCREPGPRCRPEAAERPANPIDESKSNARCMCRRF
ncbi:MFS transporter [Nocardia asteroides]|nr:MFS transporter [Nocardia asteroides]